MNIDGGKLGFKVTIDDADVDRVLARVESGIVDMAGTAETASGKVDAAMEKVSDSIVDMADTAKRESGRVEGALAAIEDSIVSVADTSSAEAGRIGRALTEVVDSIADDRPANVLNSVSEAYREMLEDAIQVYGELDPKTKRFHEQLATLDEESKSLSTAQEQLSESFARGEITQRQYRDAASALVIQQTRVEEKIGEITEELRRNEAVERSTMGSLGEKTARITQLRAQYERLSKAQRDNVQVGGKIRQEYQQLTKEVNELNEALSGTKMEGAGQIFGYIRGIAGTLGIAFGAQQLIAFGKELFDIAKQAEGVELAFARMGDTTALERLRKATKGTVSDLELMKLAVRADNFRIPMEVLAKGLEFAKRRASDTGQEVDYMVNSFVDGLGRKSTMVLDNLGISLVEIQEEVKKVGDFNIAVGNIITREMLRAGDSVDTLADKSDRLATIWQNLKKELSRAFGRGLDADNVQARTEFIQTPRLRMLEDTDEEGRKRIINELREQKKRAEELVRARTEEFNAANAFLVDVDALEKKYGKSIKDVRKELENRKIAAIEESQAINNALNNIIEKNDELAVSERQSNGIFSIEELRTKISDLTSARDKLTDPAKIREMNSEIDALTEKLARLSGSERKKEASANDKAMEAEDKARKRLLDQWVDMDADFLVKSMSKDEQEVASVRRKYSEFRKAAEEFNREVKGERISLEGLDESERKAVDAVVYRQETESLKTELDDRLELYRKFQEAREEVGVEAARRMYESEKGFTEDYRSLLTGQINALQEKQMTVGLTGVEEERLKGLNDSLDGFDKSERDRTNERLKYLLTTYATFEQKRVRLRKQADEDMEHLDEEGRKLRRKALVEEESELVRTEIEGNERFQEMLRTLDTAGSATAVRALKEGKKFVDNWINTIDDPDVKAKIKAAMDDWFAQTTENAEQGNWSNVTSLVDGFGQLVDMASQFDGSMSTALKTIGSMVSQVGQLTQTLGQTFQSVGGNLSKGGGIASIVGAVLSVFGSISEAIENSYRRREQKEREAADFQIKQLDTVTRALEYQLRIIQDIYGTERVKEYKKAVSDAYKSVNESISDLPGGLIALQSGDRSTDQLLNAFNRDFGSIEKLDEAIRRAGEEAGKLAYKLNPFKNWGRDWKTEYKILKDLRERVVDADQYRFEWESIEDITREEIARLEQMLLEGKFDEITASKIRNIIDQYGLWKEATNKLNEEVTGISLDSLINDISSIFFDVGEDSGEAFGKGFEKMMEAYMVQAFKRDFLEKAMQEYYDVYSDMASDGLDETEVAKLRKLYEESIVGPGQKIVDDLRDITGVSTGDGATSGGSSLSAGIKGITESTANRLESEFAGLRLAQLSLLDDSRARTSMASQHTDLLQRKLDILAQISSNTGRTADNTERLAGIETAIVQLNNKITNTDSLMRGAGMR